MRVVRVQNNGIIFRDWANISNCIGLSQCTDVMTVETTKQSANTLPGFLNNVACIVLE
jgi:hypothetical protein